jgi:hypothetical protein
VSKKASEQVNKESKWVSESKQSNTKQANKASIQS